jgi:DNA-binding transcriptional MerR regulator
MAKSPDAFRTISEVADWLGIQAHVLRFWESKFSQVKPVKRAGGRRYYRPNDMLLLGGIKQLLHEDGLTIKGVQKILREEGISHVASLSPPLDELTQSQMEDAEETPFIEAVPDPSEETGVVLKFDNGAAQAAEPEQSVTAAKAATKVEAQDEAPAPAEPETSDALPETAEEPVLAAEAQADANPAPKSETETQVVPEPAPEPEKTASGTEEPATPEAEATPAQEPAQQPAAALPAFLRRPMAEPAEPASDNIPAEDTAPVEAAPSEPAVQEAPPAPKPRVIEMPEITAISDIPAAPAVLSHAYRTRRLSKEQARQIAPLLERLTVLRDSMAARRRPGAHPGPND